ncbi:MAG: PilZ domain-containing protein [Candidatus Omnitrophota bacterium]
MGQRRRLARWQMNQAAILKLEKAPSQAEVAWPLMARATKEILCQIRDINCVGARITLNTKLPEDVALNISLRISENCTIAAEIWIAWHKVVNGVNHYGFCFNKIADADKEKIYRFIDMFYPNEPQHELLLGAVGDENEEGGDDLNDHRVFERFRKQFSARFMGLNGKEGEAQTFDVSAKGLGLSTTDELETKTSLEIWLDVPGSTDPVYTRGQVVWSRLSEVMGWQTGVELERADLMGISRLLRA